MSGLGDTWPSHILRMFAPQLKGQTEGQGTMKRKVFTSPALCLSTTAPHQKMEGVVSQFYIIFTSPRKWWSIIQTCLIVSKNLPTNFVSTLALADFQDTWNWRNQASALGVRAWLQGQRFVRWEPGLPWRTG